MSHLILLQNLLFYMCLVCIVLVIIRISVSKYADKHDMKHLHKYTNL